MKALDFQDYTASVPDADGDEHDSTVRAAVIGKDDVYIKDGQGNNVRREIMTIGGPRQVAEGDVYVETERPGEYDFLTAAAWASTGYASDAADDEDEALDFSEDSSDFVQPESDPEPTPPAKKTAATKRKLPGDGNGD